MTNNSNLRRVPLPILPQVDAMILAFRLQEAEAKLKQLSEKEPAKAA